MKRLHFIAIGGAAMHNLAIALKRKGYEISGSDDEIFEPSLSRLKIEKLLPEQQGWFPEKISRDIDAVILGMHARKDNPELVKAQQEGVKIYSYPEFLYEQTRNKKRVVIAGSHGKTTITAMVIHVLRHCGINFDFMVGSQLDGFDTMVSLNDDTDIAVFEGDEYLSSPLDARPKFIHYQPSIALISGIAWDHINVFSTFDKYKEQFRTLTEIIKTNGHLVYYEGDEDLCHIANQTPGHIVRHPYSEHAFLIEEGKDYLLTSKEALIPLQIFGKHNMQNINGAKIVCELLGVGAESFYAAISGFSGTSKRLQCIKQTPDFTAYLDFAHSPSKVKATLQAVREQFPDKHLVAVLELHTFSSLNKEFIPQYAHTMDLADEAVVFFNREVIEHKKLPEIFPVYVSNSFARSELKVLDKKDDLLTFFDKIDRNNTVLLLMSSGNFGGADVIRIFN